jgi:hypothetical protein
MDTPFFLVFNAHLGTLRGSAFDAVIWGDSFKSTAESFVLCVWYPKNNQENKKQQSHT